MCSAALLSGYDLIDVPSPSGSPFLRLKIFNKGEQYLSPDPLSPYDENGGVSAWTLNKDEQAALRNAGNYWGSIFDPILASNPLSSPVTINVGTYNVRNADAYSPEYGDTNGYTALGWAITGHYSETGAPHPISLIHIGPFDADLALHNFYTGPITSLPLNGQQTHLASMMMHEIGHAMGMIANINYYSYPYAYWFKADSNETNLWTKHLVDENGKAWSAGDRISYTTNPSYFFVGIYNYPYFKGSAGGAVEEVLDGAQLQIYDRSGATILTPDANLIPINGWEWVSNTLLYPDFSHIELARGVMSHQNYRNWGTLMEAELAILQEIGFPGIDREMFFGGSYYNSNTGAGGAVSLLNGHWSSTTPLAIGAHIYGHNNILTINKNINASGFGSVGIRLESDATGPGSSAGTITGAGSAQAGNELTIESGTSVLVNGEDGTGLMVSYGSGHKITHKGTIQANGAGGIGARFDFGSNYIGNNFEYRGSYIRTRNGENVSLLAPPTPTGYPSTIELTGPLVDTLNVSGTLEGTVASIYISENAFVDTINIQSGATLKGDIISYWNPYNPIVQALDANGASINRGTLMTKLNFGVDSSGQADSSSNLVFNSNIFGKESLVTNLRGGTFSFGGGRMELRSFTQYDDTTFEFSNLEANNGNPIIIAADTITLQEHATLGIGSSGKTFFNYSTDVIRFDSDNFTDNRIDKTISGAAGGGSAKIGFYDIDYTRLALSNQAISLDGIKSQTINETRAAASAMNAPLAITLFNPLPAAVQKRLAERLSLKENEANSVWFESGHTIAPATKYRLNTTPIIAGYERRFGPVFGGFALNSNFAYYKSDDADVDALDFGGSLYTGVRLPLNIGVGISTSLNGARYNQTRNVEGDSLSADYSGWTSQTTLYGQIGFPLGAVTLRPFISYDLVLLYTDGYTEKDSLYALGIGGHRELINKAGAGLAASTGIIAGFFSVESRLYGNLLFGDTHTGAGARFVNNESGDETYSSRTIEGYDFSPYIAGLELSGNFEFLVFRFSLRYTFSMMGAMDVSASHQIGLVGSFSF
jgi:hypothetical protein